MLIILIRTIESLPINKTSTHHTLILIDATSSDVSCDLSQDSSILISPRHVLVGYPTSTGMAYLPKDFTAAIVYWCPRSLPSLDPTVCQLV